MPEAVPCLVRLSIIANFIKIEKFTNGILVKTRWVPQSNMFLPCIDTECSGSEWFTKIQTIGDDGKPHTVITVPLNCVYIIDDGSGETEPQVFEHIGELCAALNGVRCEPCERVGVKGECVVNVNSLTLSNPEVPGDGIIIGLTGTTPDGYLNITIQGIDLFGFIPNPNGDVPPIDFIETLRTQTSDNLIIGRSEDGAQLDCSQTIPSYVTDVNMYDYEETAEYDVAANYPFDMACTGTVSYSLLYIDPNGGNATFDSETGILSLLKYDYVDIHAYIVATCTVDGNDSVIATICLTINTAERLNAFTYKESGAPNLVDFEAAVGFALTNPLLLGDTIYFDNVDYSITDASGFNTNTDLVSVISSANSIGASAFISTSNLLSVKLLRAVVISFAAFNDSGIYTFIATSATEVYNNVFKSCVNLINIEFGTPLIKLGDNNLDNDVFSGIVGNTITLTIPAAFNTDGDVATLQANSTVTIINV